MRWSGVARGTRALHAVVGCCPRDTGAPCELEFDQLGELGIEQAFAGAAFELNVIELFSFITDYLNNFASSKFHVLHGVTDCQ